MTYWRRTRCSNLPAGIQQRKVSFALVLSPEGLSVITDLRSDDKKPRPREMDVPLQEVRSSGIAPSTFCATTRNASSALRSSKEASLKRNSRTLPARERLLSMILAESEKEVVVVHQRSRDCFEAFKTATMRYSMTLTIGIRAFLTFLDSWSPENFNKHPRLWNT